jgi:hypothetical protein
LGIDAKWEQRENFNGIPCYVGHLGTLTVASLRPQIQQTRSRKFIQEAKTTEKAKASADDSTLKILRGRHDEVVEQFAVTRDEDEKILLLAEHERIHRAVAAYVG